MVVIKHLLTGDDDVARRAAKRRTVTRANQALVGQFFDASNAVVDVNLLYLLMLTAQVIEIRDNYTRNVPQKNAASPSFA